MSAGHVVFRGRRVARGRRTHSPWTWREVQALTDACRLGDTNSQIAAALNRTFRSVRDKIYQLGLPLRVRRSGRPIIGALWLETEQAMRVVCKRCGLRGAHECVPSIYEFAAAQLSRGDAAIKTGRRGSI